MNNKAIEIFDSGVGGLTVLAEIRKNLPNENIVQKEKILKNGGKNSVIVISITQNKEYIITFQNRIKEGTKIKKISIYEK